MRDDRFAGLDFWKATLPFLGSVYHCSMWSMATGATHKFAYIAIGVHSFRMEAFFAMAGLLSGTRLAKPGYLMRRLRTLLVPVAFLWIVLSIVNPSRGINLLGGGLLHLWFLLTLAQVTVLLVATDRLGWLRALDRPANWGTVLAVTLPLVYLLEITAPGLPVNDKSVPLTSYEALYYLPYFVLGVLVSRNAELRSSLARSKIVLLLGPLSIAATLLIWKVTQLRWWGYDGLTTPIEDLFLVASGLGMSLTVLAVCVRDFPPASRLLRWLGAAGYTVYLLHYPIIKPIYGLTMGVNPYLQYVLAVALSAGLPLLVYLGVERSKIARFLLNGVPLARMNKVSPVETAVIQVEY